MEPMAIESLVAARWELDGFLTKTRVPIRLHGGWSDVDAVGVDADGYVRIAECKVMGPPQFVQVVGPSESGWIEERLWSSTNIRELWGKEKPFWMPARKNVEELQYWFCANVWFQTGDAKTSAERRVRRIVLEGVPHGLKAKTQVRVISTFELLLEVIEAVAHETTEKDHGKRFGNPVLDTIRELVRYANPRPAGGGRGIAPTIKRETSKRLLAALRLESPPVS